MLLRLQRQLAVSPDPDLLALCDEVRGYPGVELESRLVTDPTTLLFVPMRFTGPDDGHELELFSTLATFGTALDITLAEQSIEAFFPADAETAAFFRR